MSVDVGDADMEAFLEDPAVITAFQGSIAEMAGVPEDRVEVWLTEGARRLLVKARGLAAQARRLAEVVVNYAITYPTGTNVEEKAAVVAAAGTNTTAVTELVSKNLAQQGIQDVQVAVSAFVAEVYVPTTITITTTITSTTSTTTTTTTTPPAEFPMELALILGSSAGVLFLLFVISLAWKKHWSRRLIAAGLKPTFRLCLRAQHASFHGSKRLEAIGLMVMEAGGCESPKATKAPDSQATPSTMADEAELSENVLHAVNAVAPAVVSLQRKENQERMANLEKRKLEAVENGDFVEAHRIKEQIDALKLDDKFHQLETQLRTAVARDDFEEAKRLKVEIESLQRAQEKGAGSLRFVPLTPPDTPRRMLLSGSAIDQFMSQKKDRRRGAVASEAAVAEGSSV